MYMFADDVKLYLKIVSDVDLQYMRYTLSLMHFNSGLMASKSF